MKNKKIKIMPFLFFTLVLVISGCNNNKNNFGPLGSTHVHADFKVYILGNPIDFSLSKYQLKDQLTHVENDDGDVIHMHATRINLGYFFETIGMKIDNNCITLDIGNKYCNHDNAKFKVFLKNGNSDWEQLYYPADYVMQDLDKILVTYGTENGEKIKKQEGSVTDKAKAAGGMD